MKKLTSVLCLTVGMILTANSALASSHEDSTRELFAVMEVEKQMKSGFDAMMPMIDQMAAQMQLDEAAKSELRGIYSDWFMKDLDQKGMVEKMVTLYTDAFSEEDIKALIKFYKTPVGQKFLAKQGQLTQMQAQIGMMEANAKQGQLQARLLPFMQKHQK